MALVNVDKICQSLKTRGLHFGQLNVNSLLSKIDELRDIKNYIKPEVSVRKTTFYDKSSFFKIIGDAFRTDYVCSLSSHFTY